jgi:hypothetical protein
VIPKSLSSQVLGFAFSVFAAAFLLNAAWKLLLPLLPFIVFAAVVIGLSLAVVPIVRYFRYR